MKSSLVAILYTIYMQLRHCEFFALINSHGAFGVRPRVFNSITIGLISIKFGMNVIPLDDTCFSRSRVIEGHLMSS